MRAAARRRKCPPAHPGGPVGASAPRPGRTRLGQAQPRCLAAVGEESFRNVEQRSYSSCSPIACGGAGEGVQGAQEAAVRLVLPGHRAVALPAAAAQRVQAAVVAGAGVGVRLDDAARLERVVGELRPGQRGGGVLRGDLGGGRAGREQLAGLRVVGQVGRGRAPEQVLVNGHGFQSGPCVGLGPPCGRCAAGAAGR